MAPCDAVSADCLPSPSEVPNSEFGTSLFFAADVPTAVGATVDGHALAAVSMPTAAGAA